MTLTLSAVYAPVAFSPGRTGKLFAEFALTLAGAVLVSGMVALTLSPMLCSKFLRGHEKHGRFYNFIETGLVALNRHYRRALIATLQVRPLVMLLSLVRCRVCLSYFQQFEVGTGADRGPRGAFHRRHRAGGFDHRVHQPLCRPHGSLAEANT